MPVVITAFEVPQGQLDGFAPPDPDGLSRAAVACLDRAAASPPAEPERGPDAWERGFGAALASIDLAGVPGRG